MDPQEPGKEKNDGQCKNSPCKDGILHDPVLKVITQNPEPVRSRNPMLRLHYQKPKCVGQHPFTVTNV